MKDTSFSSVHNKTFFFSSPLTVLKVFPFITGFGQFDYIPSCSSSFVLGFIKLFKTMVYTFTKFEKILAMIYSNISSFPHHSPLSFKDFNYTYIRRLEIVHSSLMFIFFFLNHFSHCILFWIVSVTISSNLVISFAMSFLYLVSSSVFYF